MIQNYAYHDVSLVVSDNRGPLLPIVQASATESVRQSIAATLGLVNPDVLQASFNRPNIAYEIKFKELLGGGGDDDVLQHLLAFIAERPGKISQMWLHDCIVNVSIMILCCHRCTCRRSVTKLQRRAALFCRIEQHVYDCTLPLTGKR